MELQCPRRAQLAGGYYEDLETTAMSYNDDVEGGRVVLSEESDYERGRPSIVHIGA